MGFLSRNKIYEKVSPGKDAKKVYLLCEGDKEVNYFKYFQGFSSNIDIIPVPNVDGKSDPVKLMNCSRELFLGDPAKDILPQFELKSEYRDEVWFIIDTDRWNEGEKIALLKTFCRELSIDNQRWCVAQSNPCFELWLYYHVATDKPGKEEVDKCKSFKEFVNGKIKGGFDLRRMPIELETACKNSRDTFVSVNDQPDLYSTEVHHIGDMILGFIGEQLNKAKSMQNAVAHKEL